MSKFALETVFNPKTTEWQLSYDGRNKEPITLPVKFPLLLAQGAEGIAVGLSSKILPHNLNDICDAAIHHTCVARSSISILTSQQGVALMFRNIMMASEVAY